MKQENFKFVKLAAEIGLFFAKVDNDYDEREKTFLVDYIKELEKSNPLSEEEKSLISKMSEHHFSLNEVIQDTKDLLNEYGEEDRFPLLNTISVMINQVINADEKVTKEEADSFALWKKEFGIK